MNELQFVSLRQADWARWDHWLELREPGAARLTDSERRAWRRTAKDAIKASELAAMFRSLCLDLSLARDRNYSALLVDSLQHRVLAAHQRLYGAQPRLGREVAEFLLGGLPRAVRRESLYVAAAAFLFLVPLVVTILAIQAYPEGVYLLVSPEQVAGYDRMYTPQNGVVRGPTQDWMMYAFYIGNNVRINFQCFAGGLLFGVGSVFYLVFNGLFGGAIAGHLTQTGLSQPFWTFVAGHSPFELTGVILSGAAGLRLGASLVAPRRRSRRSALLEGARAAAPLIYGAALLTFFAAFIEAFWSPLRAVPAPLKYSVGIGLWALVIFYFVFSGRGRATPA